MLDETTDTKNERVNGETAALAREHSTESNERMPEGDPAGTGRTGFFGRALGLRPDRSGKPDPAVEKAPKALTLADIRVGRLDGRGCRISTIYAVQPDEYVIYMAGEVMVQFADDAAKAQAQRKAILPIGVLRAEVNALVEGLKCRSLCDGQIAHGLQLALDGEPVGAKATIAAAKSAILAKRGARGRFQYLKWSFATAALFTALLFLAGRLHPFTEASDNLWLAAKAGLIGAVFSIALAIRGRTVALDTEPLDNISDGAMRLLIGIIAAGVLLLLFSSGMAPSLKIGDVGFRPDTLTWQPVLILGFIAGFLERLVPDLLDRHNAQGQGTPTPA